MKSVAKVISSLVIASCLASASAQQAVRVAGLKPDMASPEAGLWTLSDKAEIEARQSAELNRDPALNAYVRGVACKVSATYCNEMRIYVMDRPFFNASMAPNGYMEVWSGMLLRAGSEAELAFVLGHEIGHFAHSHSWQSFQDTKARANGAMALSFLISAAGVVAMANAGTADAVQNISNATQGLVNAVYLGAVAGIFSFNRDNEGHADTFGFHAATQANYDPSAPAAIWRRLIKETAASDFENTRKSETRMSIFNSHPLASDRLQALDALSQGRPKGLTEEQHYRAAIRPHLSAWLRDDLRRRDFGQTLFVIDQLMTSGEDMGVLNYYRGEAVRLRRNAGYQAAAEDAYRAAIAYPDAPAAAFRELADLAEKKREKEQMADLLIAYLQRDPAAKDAAFIRMRIEQVKPMPVTAPVEAHVAPTESPPASDAPVDKQPPDKSVGPPATAPLPTQPPLVATLTEPAP